MRNTWGRLKQRPLFFIRIMTKLPSIKEIAKALGMTVAQLDALMRSLAKK